MDEVTCIVCPNGCRIAKKNHGRKVTYVGNGCEKGLDYAREEFINPKRMITTTVRISGAREPLLSVRTSAPIARREVMELMRRLSEIEVNAPVKAGEVVFENGLDEGVVVVSTKNLDIDS